MNNNPGGFSIGGNVGVKILREQLWITAKRIFGKVLGWLGAAGLNLLG